MEVHVGDDGVRFSERSDESVGVEIGSHRVWAVNPSRDGHRDGRRTGRGGWLVPWPPLLRPYLNGRADVVVRTLAAGDVWFEDSVHLGDGEGVVAVVGATGRPLAVDKGNHVGEMFSDVDEDVKAEIVGAVGRVLDFLNGNGHRAFLAFGCLLGAVREGSLIGHDNDGDVAYVARATHPVDIMVESMQIQRQFVEAGWETRRMSGGGFKVRARLAGGKVVGIDVFTAFYLSGTLHVMPNVMADLPLDALLPQSTVELEGQWLPAPADPLALLEATYGPSWRVPDPAFKFQPPRAVRRRIGGLMRGESRHINYWNDFHKTEPTPTEPSAFARWVFEREPASSSVLDLGAGTGRDSLWFAEQGFTVLGCDYSLTAVTFARKKAEKGAIDADFRMFNLYDLRQVLTAAGLLPRQRKFDAVYARFLVDVLEPEGRTNLWRLSRNVLRGAKGRIYLEFRTEPAPPELVAEELRTYGFTVEHSNEDQGVCRIVARLEA